MLNLKYLHVKNKRTAYYVDAFTKKYINTYD